MIANAERPFTLLVGETNAGMALRVGTENDRFDAMRQSLDREGAVKATDPVGWRALHLTFDREMVPTVKPTRSTPLHLA